MGNSLPYAEPNVVDILVLSSFLTVLNLINWTLDKLLFCGLLGQIAIGIAWGTPGGNWISEDVQNAVAWLGYLGLILLVYEGGLSTNISALRSHLFLSVLVALIGVSMPIALSFVLQRLLDGTTALQAFAAGAALCSTSLGTTFTILGTTGLDASRLGVVLSSAAMLDDIVGLVMSGIIATLGQSTQDFSAVTVIRPVFVSIAFAVVVPVLCAFVVRPVTKLLLRSMVTQKSHNTIGSFLGKDGFVATMHVLLLLAFVAGTSYTGTSNLFGAYLAGACITWWDGSVRAMAITDELQESSNEVTQPSSETTGTNDESQGEHDAQELCTSQATGSHPSEEDVSVADHLSSQSSEVDKFGLITGGKSFGHYIKPALDTILKPFFFASIGFAIPIGQMFEGPIIWRGIVYSILMTVGKLVCGLCLIRFTISGSILSTITTPILRLVRGISSCLPWRAHAGQARQSSGRTDSMDNASSSMSGNRRQVSNSRARIQPMSLYPAALLGSAMVARGEIGFLISNVAESDGIFASSDGGSSDLFLIVTWAVLLCTLAGPVAMGLLVKRVKRLQTAERGGQNGREDPLGIWGFPVKT